MKIDEVTLEPGALIENMTVTGKKVLILRAFVKKSQKTPTLDLEMARTRSANIARRPGAN